jgi:hypothetical protein
MGPAPSQPFAGDVGVVVAFDHKRLKDAVDRRGRMGALNRAGGGGGTRSHSPGSSGGAGGCG